MKKSGYPGLILVFIVAFLIGTFFSSKNVSIEEYSYNYKATNFSSLKFATISVPAVNENGIGIATNLSVYIIDGYGRILVNIDRILFWTDVQNSIRTAKKVAESYTGIDLSKYDLIYTIDTDATSVEGPSAGAALTVITIAALLNRKINNSVTLTGTINHDGTIGPVSNILEKARFSKKIGKKLILVPFGQKEERKLEEKRYCEKIGNSQICSTERTIVKRDVEKETGISVREVKDIADVLNYVLI